jgi:hypothetical protein
LPPAPAYGDDATAVDWPPRRTEPRDGAQRDDDDSVARINLRLPERLKARVEQAAADEGVSVNSWLVRTTASAVERGDPNRRSEPRTGYGAQRYRGWAR